MTPGLAWGASRWRPAGLAVLVLLAPCRAADPAPAGGVPALSVRLEHGEGELVLRITNQSGRRVHLTRIAPHGTGLHLYRYNPHVAPGRRLDEPMATSFPCGSCKRVRPDIHPLPAGGTSVHRMGWNEINKYFFPASGHCFFYVAIYRHRSIDGLVRSEPSNALWACR